MCSTVASLLLCLHDRLNISLLQTLYSITEVKTCLITHCLPSLGSALVLNPLYTWDVFTHQENINKVQCHKSNSAQYLHVDYCQQSLLRVCVTWTMLKLGFDSLLNEFWSHSGLFFDEREAATHCTPITLSLCLPQKGSQE